MADASYDECKLLADLLPTCVRVSDFFASSDDAAAVRVGDGSATFYENLHYEFCRLQAGQIVNDDDSLTVLGVGVKPLLRMLESRVPRLRQTWLPKRTFGGLEDLRSKVCEQQLSIEVLCKRIRLRTSSPESCRHIIKCLQNCNPEPLLPKEPFPIVNDYTSYREAPSSPLFTVSSLASHSHQLLRKNWACTCVPPVSYVEVKLFLTTYRSNRLTEAMRFELLLSTPEKNCPWQETEIDVVADPTSFVETNMDRKVTFTVEQIEEKKARPSMERWKVESICGHVRLTLGARCRLLIEGDSMWHLRPARPARPKIKDLKKAVHISLRDLIHNGYFLRRTTQKDKLLLAYIMASSILSLYKGPWLDRGWTKDQVFFLSRSGDPSTLDLGKPLLLTMCLDIRGSSPHPQDIHPEPPIATLGIVMLEIALRMTIESQRDDGPINSNTDLLNAYPLLEQLQNDENSIPNHVVAIKNCLEPEDILGKGLDGETERQKLYNNIVGPIEAILAAYGIETANLELSLGKGQEPPVPVTRYPLNSQISSTTGMSPVGSTEHLSVDARMPLGSVSAEKWFEDLQTYVFPLFAKEPARKVKIAILDSGIDRPFEVRYAYEDRISYRSWIEGDSTDKTDTCGHGTHAAGLLLKVSDHADMFVARITENGELHPGIISEAIKYAVDVWEVDIITMSFGFPEIEPSIDEALGHAFAKNTILLAAASNSGNRHSIWWPARSEYLICIHSLNGDGDHSSYTPNSRPQDFGILGQSVSSYWPPHLNAGTSVLRSGTSCAAPIAAGVAALVLEYAQEKLPLYAEPGSKVDEHVIQRLRSNAGMRVVFRLMSRNRDGHNCLILWSLFDCRKRESTICDAILQELRKI